MAKKRYDDGGEISAEDALAQSGSPENDSNAGMAEAAETAPKKTTFKEAFAAARKAGDKSFQWEGKKFSTEMAGEKKAAPKAAPKAEAAPKTESAKPKMNILEEAKDIARRRATGSAKVQEARDARMSYGRGPGLSALKGMKEGGGVKGWGMARGARKAKTY